MQAFIDYIIGLAPAGETALLVRQKPVVHNGEHLSHADGSSKYTWPAYLPSHRVRPNEAWYANTGSFVVDRFEKGRPSASAANCDFVLVMMLDDVGDPKKAPRTPPLPPTWIMETSAGSFQWGYAFNDQPSKAEYAAAIRAIADAGYSDPGACNPVRNFRLPGSINLKPDKRGFPARLVSFNPEREYALGAICEALGVKPAPPDTVQMPSIRLTDTGTDSVVKWLSDNGFVLGRPNAEGWMGVVCPNKDAHSDGQIEARYRPLTRAFCCLHAHCEHLDSAAYLDWVAGNGGPRVQAGLRDDLMAETMKTALDAIPPQDTMFQDTAADAIAEAQRKELARVEKNDWYQRFVYVTADDCYFDVVTRREISRKSFNALFRHIPCKSIHGGRKIEASICFDENRDRLGRAIDGVTYAAGDTDLVGQDGDVFANRWRDERPAKTAPGDVQMWLDHCKTLVPDKETLEHCFDVMAFKLQNPKVKINHAVLHGGDEGCGKDTMWAPFLWAVTGPELRNRGMLDNDTMNTQWGYQFESEVLILNELKQPEAKDRRSLANKLKPLIAAPPDSLVVNRKGLHPYSMPNRLFVLAFSNDPVPIVLESQDRRWFVIWSDAPRMQAHEANEIWSWYKSVGFGRCARWLYDRDVSNFNPAAAPPVTEYKERLVASGRSASESFLLEHIRMGTGDFAKGVIAGPFHALLDRLQGQAPSGMKLTTAPLYLALKEAGWRDLGLCSKDSNSTKRHVFARRTLANQHGKVKLIEMAEQTDAPKLVVINKKSA